MPCVTRIYSFKTCFKNTLLCFMYYPKHWDTAMHTIDFKSLSSSRIFYWLSRKKLLLPLKKFTASFSLFSFFFPSSKATTAAKHTHDYNTERIGVGNCNESNDICLLEISGHCDFITTMLTVKC